MDGCRGWTVVGTVREWRVVGGGRLQGVDGCTGWTLAEPR